MITEKSTTRLPQQRGNLGASLSHDYGDISTVSFDAAGTLISPHPSVGAIYAQALRRHGVVVDSGTIEQRFRKTFKRAHQKVRTNLNDDTERLFWRNIVRSTLGRFCTKESFPVIFDELYEDFASGSRWKLAPDARETITELRKRDYRIVLLSNSDNRIRRVLAELEIDHLFAGIFLSCEISCEKPDPRAFHFVAEKMACTPHHMLHIGDSWQHDVEGARTAGWHSLIVDPEAGAAGHSNIPSLSALLTLLPDCAC